jgi:uncharacterized protein (TIGR03435 family)
MRTGLTVAGVLALVAGVVFGQNAQVFDVASVKPSPNNDGRGAGGGRGGMGILAGGLARAGNFATSPGGVTIRNATLSGCIQWAYGVRDFQVSGPSWLTDDRFDITAKAAGEVSGDQLRLMLQALLADRFKLALHRQSKELQAYALVVGKNGSKLHESTSEGPSNIRRERMGVTVERATLAQFADALTQVLQIPVVDATGMAGHYDATLDITPYITLDGAGGTDIVSIAVAALQDLLGLRLEVRKAPTEILVVDHVERVPTQE